MKSKKTTVIAQPLMDGVLMIGPRRSAMAVRKSNKSITIEEKRQGRLLIFFRKFPFLRGCVRLFTQIGVSTGWLLRSTEISQQEKVAPDSKDSFLPEAVDSSNLSEKEKLDLEKEALRARIAAKGKPVTDASSEDADLQMPGKAHFYSWIAVVVGIVFSSVIFLLLPRLTVDFIISFFPRNWLGNLYVILLANITEGILRIGVFLLFLSLTSKVKEIAVLWMYNGAGQKVISCYEAGAVPSLENIKKQSCFRARSGISFLFVVILFSILAFSAVGIFLEPFGFFVDLLFRIILVFVIAGVFYEIMHLAARFEHLWIGRVFLMPGHFIQKFTTKEPENSMLEVALAALEAVIPEEEDEDNW